MRIYSGRTDSCSRTFSLVVLSVELKARTEWWRTNRTSPLSIPKPKALRHRGFSNSKRSKQHNLLTYCGTHDFDITISPIFVEFRLFAVSSLRMIYTCFDLVVTKFLQLFRHIFRILPKSAKKSSWSAGTSTTSSYFFG